MRKEHAETVKINTREYCECCMATLGLRGPYEPCEEVLGLPSADENGRGGQERACCHATTAWSGRVREHEESKAKLRTESET